MSDTLTTAASPAPLLTVPQVAERLSVSRELVYLLMRRGELAYIELPRKPGARWSGRRIEPAEIDAFIERNRQATSA